MLLAVAAVAVTHAFTTLPSGLSLGRDHAGALSQQPASHVCQSRRKDDAIKRCTLERTALLRLRAAEMTLGVSAEPPEEDPLEDIPAVLMQDADGMCIIAAKYSKNVSCQTKIQKNMKYVESKTTSISIGEKC